MLNALFDLIFPRRCVGCGQWGNNFCHECHKKIVPAFYLCPVCEKPAFGGMTHPQCLTKYSLDGLVSLFRYKPPLKNLIFKLKYRFLFSLQKEIDFLLIKELKKRFKEPAGKIFKSFLKEKLMLVPVPLHFWRENWRGFNQAELLCQAVAREFNLVICEDLLQRTRFTAPQSLLDKKTRETNIKGIFKINPEKKLPEKVLLVDDVWTTGSTLKTCGTLLKRKGVKEVWAFTLAR